jgi:hypothetical protein
MIALAKTLAFRKLLQFRLKELAPRNRPPPPAVVMPEPPRSGGLNFKLGAVWAVTQTGINPSKITKLRECHQMRSLTF